MSNFQIGDEVMAPWANDGFLYPAVLVGLEGAAAHVAYLDGDEADVPVAALQQGALGPGLAVNVNWKGRRTYYNGVVRRRVHQALFVDYEDGDRGWTTVAQCRVRVELLAGRPPETRACAYCGAGIPVSAAHCPNCGAPYRPRS
jgi:hypothetical protein